MSLCEVSYADFSSASFATLTREISPSFAPLLRGGRAGVLKSVHMIANHNDRRKLQSVHVRFKSNFAFTVFYQRALNSHSGGQWHLEEKCLQCGGGLRGADLSAPLACGGCGHRSGWSNNFLLVQLDQCTDGSSARNSYLTPSASELWQGTLATRLQLAGREPLTALLDSTEFVLAIDRALAIAESL